MRPIPGRLEPLTISDAKMQFYEDNPTAAVDDLLYFMALLKESRDILDDVADASLSLMNQQDNAADLVELIDKALEE